MTPANPEIEGWAKKEAVSNPLFGKIRIRYFKFYKNKTIEWYASNTDITPKGTLENIINYTEGTNSNGFFIELSNQNNGKLKIYRLGPGDNRHQLDLNRLKSFFEPDLKSAPVSTPPLASVVTPAPVPVVATADTEQNPFTQSNNSLETLQIEKERLEQLEEYCQVDYVGDDLIRTQENIVKQILQSLNYSGDKNEIEFMKQKARQHMNFEFDRDYSINVFQSYKDIKDFKQILKNIFNKEITVIQQRYLHLDRKDLLGQGAFGIVYGSKCSDENSPLDEKYFNKKVLCPLNAPKDNKMVSKIMNITGDTETTDDTETKALTQIADKIHLIVEMKELELRIGQSEFVKANIQKLLAQDKLKKEASLLVLPLVDNSIELSYLIYPENIDTFYRDELIISFETYTKLNNKLEQTFFNCDLLEYHKRSLPLFECTTIDIIMRDLLFTLRFLHEKLSLVHLDIKAENILIIKDITSSRFYPVLIDFGFTKDIRKLQDGKYSLDDLLEGSSDYFSYEKIVNHKNVLCGSEDIWSLGVLYYELIYRTEPFIPPDYSNKEIVTLLDDHRKTIDSRLQGILMLGPSNIGYFFDINYLNRTWDPGSPLLEFYQKLVDQKDTHFTQVV